MDEDEALFAELAAELAANAAAAELADSEAVDEEDELALLLREAQLEIIRSQSQQPAEPQPAAADSPEAADSDEHGRDEGGQADEQQEAQAADEEQQAQAGSAPDRPAEDDDDDDDDDQDQLKHRSEAEADPALSPDQLMQDELEPADEQQDQPHAPDVPAQATIEPQQAQVNESPAATKPLMNSATTMADEDDSDEQARQAAGQVLEMLIEAAAASSAAVASSSSVAASSNAAPLSPPKEASSDQGRDMEQVGDDDLEAGLTAVLGMSSAALDDIPVDVAPGQSASHLSAAVVDSSAYEPSGTRLLALSSTAVANEDYRPPSPPAFSAVIAAAADYAPAPPTLTVTTGEGAAYVPPLRQLQETELPAASYAPPARPPLTAAIMAGESIAPSADYVDPEVHAALLAEREQLQAQLTEVRAQVVRAEAETIDARQQLKRLDIDRQAQIDQLSLAHEEQLIAQRREFQTQFDALKRQLAAAEEASREAATEHAAALAKAQAQVELYIQAAQKRTEEGQVQLSEQEEKLVSAKAEIAQLKSQITDLKPMAARAAEAEAMAERLLSSQAALEVENKRLQLVARAAQDTAEQASSLRQDHDERQKSLENTIAELEAALAKERADLTRALLKVQDISKVNDELLVRVRAEQEGARLAQKALDDRKSSSLAGEQDLRRQLDAAAEQIQSLHRELRTVERQSLEAREKALAEVREADAARRSVEAELRALRGLGSVAVADREAAAAAAATDREQLISLQRKSKAIEMELRTEVQRLQDETEQLRQALQEADRQRESAVGRVADLQQELDSLAGRLTSSQGGQQMTARPATDRQADLDDPVVRNLAAALGNKPNASYSDNILSLDDDSRSELVRLRLAHRLHGAEVSRLEAKQMDLQARVQALVAELAKAQGEKNQLIAGNVDVKELRREAVVAQQRAMLAEEELKTTRERLGKEVAQRAKLEVSLTTVTVDHKHAESRIAELQRQCEKLQHELEQTQYGGSARYGYIGDSTANKLQSPASRNGLGGFNDEASRGGSVGGGIEWFNPAASLSQRSNYDAGVRDMMGPYAMLLSQPSKPFQLGSLSSPEDSGAYGTGQQDVLGGRSLMDYMQDARLAEQRAKAAEKREAQLLVRLKALEQGQLPGLSATSKSSSNNTVSLTVHSQMLELAEQRAKDGERRVRELESECLALRGQVRTAESLHVALRSTEVVDKLSSKLDACLALAQPLAFAADDELKLPPAPSRGAGSSDADGYNPQQALMALVQQLQAMGINQPSTLSATAGDSNKGLEARAQPNQGEGGSSADQPQRADTAAVSRSMSADPGRTASVSSRNNARSPAVQSRAKAGDSSAAPVAADAVGRLSPPPQSSPVQSAATPPPALRVVADDLLQGETAPLSPTSPLSISSRSLSKDSAVARDLPRSNSHGATAAAVVAPKSPRSPKMQRRVAQFEQASHEPEAQGSSTPPPTSAKPSPRKLDRSLLKQLDVGLSSGALEQSNPLGYLQKLRQLRRPRGGSSSSTEDDEEEEHHTDAETQGGGPQTTAVLAGATPSKATADSGSEWTPSEDEDELSTQSKRTHGGPAPPPSLAVPGGSADAPEASVDDLTGAALVRPPSLHSSFRRPTNSNKRLPSRRRATLDKEAAEDLFAPGTDAAPAEEAAAAAVPAAKKAAPPPPAPKPKPKPKPKA